MRSVASFLALSWALGALAACSTANDLTRAAYEIASPGAAADLPMAQLPTAAGDVVTIVQALDRGVLTQKIVLKGDPTVWGENGVVVTVDERPEARPGEPSWAVPKPTETQISRELRENFADIDMGIGQTWTRNAFGPFGYAVGKTHSGVTCLYAWQFSAGRTNIFPRNPAAEADAASTPVAPTSVRVRLCKQNASDAELVAMVSQMAVYPPHSTTPYMDPSFRPAETPPSDALEATGLPGAFYMGPRRNASLDDEDPPAKPRAKPKAKAAEKSKVKTAKAKHKHHAPKPEEDADLPAEAPMNATLPPVVVPTLGASGVATVPSANGPAVAPVASNPLTAPLKGVFDRKPGAVSDLPLPPAAGGGAPSAASAAAPAPIPLPQ